MRKVLELKHTNFKPTEILVHGEYLLLGDPAFKNGKGKVLLFKNDELIDEYETKKDFFRIGESIWIGTDSQESGPDTKLMMGTIHADADAPGQDLSLDLFKVVDERLMPYAEHAAILKYFPTYQTSKYLSFCSGRAVWR
jgi:hypothetical protein